MAPAARGARERVPEFGGCGQGAGLPLPILALCGGASDDWVMTPPEDRRRQRSDDPLVALHYQLTHARRDGRLEAVVVADDWGVVLAGAGAWAACEELAAYAPLLAQEATTEAEASESRMAELRTQV